MNEDKITEGYSLEELVGFYNDPNNVTYQRYLIFDEVVSRLKAALATRPDVNQELVEALEGLLANPHTIYQRGLTQTTVYNPVENAYKTLAKHKAGESAGFTEDAIQPKYIAVEIYDREIRYDNKIIYTGDVKNLGNDRIEQIVADYKAANALRLRGE